MVISFLVAVYVQFVHGALGFPAPHPALALVAGVLITTTGWLAVTLLTPPADRATLQAFYDRIRPAPRGWRRAVDTSHYDGAGMGSAGLAWFLGCVAVYGAIFGVGYLVYGAVGPGSVCLAVVAAAAWGLVRVVPRLDLLG